MAERVRIEVERLALGMLPQWTRRPLRPGLSEDRPDQSACLLFTIIQSAQHVRRFGVSHLDQVGEA